MRDLLIGGWEEIRRLWSVWIGVFGTLLMVVIPIIDTQWPTLAPNLAILFPNNGQQWIPITGAIIAILARILSQSAVIDLFKKLLDKDAE